MKKLAAKLSLVYGTKIRIRGPYLCRDGRKRVDVITVAGARTHQLARIKLEVKLGRRLRRNETVDHKDEDKTNDRYANLQCLSLAQNCAKGARGNTHTKGRVVPDHEKKRGDKNGKARVSNEWAKNARIRFKTGKVTRKKLCLESGLSDRSIRNLLSKLSYCDAGGPSNKAKKIGRPKGGRGEAG